MPITGTIQRKRKTGFAKIGVSAGMPHWTLLEAARQVKAGLAVGTIKRFQKASGWPLARIKQLAHLSEGTLARRRRSGRLSQQESERLLRLVRIFEQAASLYDGDLAGTRLWLDTPVPALDNQRPIELAQTEPGAREVEDFIGRIGHGIIS